MTTDLDSPAPPCTWPDCLTPEESAELVADIGVELHGGTAPARDDKRVVCGCREEADACTADCPNHATPAELERRQRSARFESGLCPRCGKQERADDFGLGRLCDGCTSAVRKLKSWERRTWDRYRQPATGQPIQGSGYTPAELLGIGEADAPTSVGTTGAPANETGGRVGTGPDFADWNSPEDASYDGLAPADSDPARDGLRQRYAAAMWRAAEHTVIAEWICCEPLNPKHDLCAKGYAALAMTRALIVDDPEAWRPAVLTDAVLAVRDAEMGRLAALVTAQREVIERQAREALAVVTEPGTPRVRRDVTPEQVAGTQARLRSLYRQGRPE